MPLPKALTCHVVLNNMCSGKEPLRGMSQSTAGSRSNFVQVGSRIPVLTPPRGDRAHLESLISDVWTRDILFCTGLAARPKGGHHRRPSASSIMRKLSVASLTGTFSKRPTSHASSHKAAGVEHDILRQVDLLQQPEGGSVGGQGLVYKASTESRKIDQINVAVHERTSSDISASFDRQCERSYFLEGITERMKYSLQKRSNHTGSTAVAANIPRSSATRFIEEMGPRRSDSTGETDNPAHRAATMSPSMPDLSPHGSQSTADISLSSSTVQMMPPLTLQPPRAHSIKQARHWLGRPLLHRRSFRRSTKETHH
ncbi:uncharacterized protein SPSK_05461 [Sporothrix schenckii 1099-18]|uniref:Uncharacterized protein n=1 Tax=Sporothrix schenckii 1099-18 TaxID=1397361 RepID=A0A0F2LUQ2_SPOSC|nr:uncharacterized protein SPSK_05461 [Sporothrix schenckii 1099-18]KJR80569.1 hypothetical protein SPSK_05461 [Sporothrix schenckii 1099-18]